MPIGGIFILMMTGVAFVVGCLCNVYFRHLGKIAIVAAKGDVESIIPMYIKSAHACLVRLALQALSLLSAAMSTLSSQFHAMGTSPGPRLLRTGLPARVRAGGGGVMATRLAIPAGIIASV